MQPGSIYVDVFHRIITIPTERYSPTPQMARPSKGSRKLTHAAFFLAVVSIAFGQANPETTPETPMPDDVRRRTDKVIEEPPELSEAEKAYSQALRGIRFLNAIPPAQAGAYYANPYPQPNALITTLFPNENGLVGRLARAVYTVRHQHWLPGWISRRFGGRTGRRREEVRGRAAKVVDLLQRAIDLGHEEALYTMAEISMFPPTAVPLNVSRAFDSYSRHAEITGNATSQAMIGFFHATGHGGAVEVDQSQALLHYSFAALAGSQRADMIMGYRHWAGIGVNEDCMTALSWYEAAAEKAMGAFYDGPPGGRTLPPTFTRLSDVDGGVYGPGASVASTGSNSVRPVMKAAYSKAAGETWEDVLEYYQYHADRGEIDFSYRLGKIYYHGSVYTALGGAASGAEGVGMIGRDFQRARAYFVSITRMVWPSNQVRYPLANKKEVDDKVGNAAAMAAGYLGRMYLRGEGVKKDAKVAKMWFDRGVEYGDRECQMGLGLIWRDGLIDGKTDLGSAIAYFTAAAGQDLAEAQVQLGRHYYELGDYVKATTFFNSAISHGSPFEPYYYIAEMHSNTAHNPLSDPSIRGGSCGIAVSFYKLVAERGSWMDDLVGSAEMLWDMNGVRTGGRGVAGSHVVASTGGPSKIVRDAEREMAKAKWWIAAEAGYEVAQNNLAYLMDQDTSALRRALGTPASNETAQLALTQWIRSASQRNVDALVKVGDYYYYSLGVSDEPEIERWEKAAGYYHRAVETQVSALAMWNLGWMYENGRGVPQDFHLAKRYYDLALETNFEAYLPVMMSLIKLYARSFWYSFTGGTEKTFTLAVWDVLEESDDPWYLGRAKSELQKRWTGTQGELDHDDRGVQSGGTSGGYQDDDIDSVQWARDRKREEVERAQAEHDADGGFGPDDYFDSAVNRPGHRENFDRDDTLDDLIFMAVLCGILGFLIYMRTRWVQEQAPLEHPELPPQ